MKQGDFHSLAAGRPMMFYRDLVKARADWEAGWRDVFEASFPAAVATIDAALGTTPDDDDDGDEGDEGDEPG